MKITTVSEMRKLDKTAVEKYNIPEELLMENAGQAVSSVIAREIGISGKKILIFSGLGNNGGDGLVVARKLHSNGGQIKVFLLGDPSRYQGAAKLNYNILRQLPVAVHQLQNVADVKREIAECDAIVDAMLGTGITRDLGGLYQGVVMAVNQSEKPVFSVDIPSGVNGNTGKVMGTAVCAKYTITFGLPKIGNMLYPGYELCGKQYVTHISFPQPMTQDPTLKIEINHPLPLPPRPREAHKGSMGKALFIAGASGYYGAPYFSALSFLKAGGGYSRLASPSSITPFLANKGIEIVFIPQRETSAGSIALENKEALLNLAEQMEVVVLGPGLSLENESQQLARELASGIEKPLLIDGDGITALCQDLEIIKGRQVETILTPHLGEMARLTKMDLEEVRANKIDVLRHACQALSAIIVLKGAHSLVGYPDGRIYINLSGNPGMATAGSGDVLTGTIAAMRGLGLSLQDAVRQGVFVHGLSGDLAADEKGEDGITAQDILDYLPQSLKTLRAGMSKRLCERYQGVSVV